MEGSFIENIQMTLYWYLRHEKPVSLKNYFFLFFNIFQIVCLFLLSKFIRDNRKKDGKIVIGFSNLYFNGNTRAVFEYVQNHLEKYEVFWFADDFNSLQKVRKSGSKAFLKNGILGIPYFYKADVWITGRTGGINIPALPHKKYITIQLFHGIGVKPKHRKKNYYAPYDVWCLPSTYSKKRQIELYNAPSHKIQVTGFPRIDSLVKYLDYPKEKILNELKIKKNKKIIFYAPTWGIGSQYMGDGLWPWGDEIKQFENVCEFCQENDLTLILRLHPYASIKRDESKIKTLKSIMKRYENIYWLDMKDEPQTTKLLAITDILITDWSSIFTDFYLTERPIIFLEDEESKKLIQKQKKSEIPLNFRAGEIVNSESEFYDTLEFILTKGNRYKDEQRVLFKKIHGEADGKASERVVKVIEDLLG